MRSDIRSPHAQRTSRRRPAVYRRLGKHMRSPPDGIRPRNCQKACHPTPHSASAPAPFPPDDSIVVFNEPSRISHASTVAHPRVAQKREFRHPGRAALPGRTVALNHSRSASPRLTAPESSRCTKRRGRMAGRARSIRRARHRPLLDTPAAWIQSGRR